MCMLPSVCTAVNVYLSIGRHMHVCNQSLCHKWVHISTKEILLCGVAQLILVCSQSQSQVLVIGKV